MHLAHLALEAEFLSRLSVTAMDVNMNCLLQIVRYSVCVIYPDPRSSVLEYYASGLLSRQPGTNVEMNRVV
eukprot:4700515-Pleurochrysis_carterae.AAC.1